MYLLIWRHYHVPFSFPTLTEYTVLGNKPRLTFSHLLGADAHHVHQALAGQDYHSQHAPRIGVVPQSVGDIWAWNHAPETQKQGERPSIQASMVHPRPGPLRPRASELAQTLVLFARRRWFALPLPCGFGLSPEGRRSFRPALGVSGSKLPSSPWTAFGRGCFLNINFRDSEWAYLEVLGPGWHSEGVYFWGDPFEAVLGDLGGI